MTHPEQPEQTKPTKAEAWAGFWDVATTHLAKRRDLLPDPVRPTEPDVPLTDDTSRF